MADIKEITNRWLARNTKAKGVLACGVRYADASTFNQSSSSDFSAAALDHSWNSVAGMFHFLNQHQNDVDQMCWNFENHLLHCVVRHDDTCLGIFTPKGPEAYDSTAVTRMISEFKSLRGGEKGSRPAF